MIVGMAVPTTVESRAATAMAAMIPAVTISWSRVSGASRSLDVAGSILVSDGGMAAPDAEVRGGQHHCHCRLSQVVLIHRPIALGRRFRQHKDNGRLGYGQVAGADPDRRQLLQLIRLGNEDEVPLLAV